MKNYILQSIDAINAFDLETGYLKYVLEQLTGTTWSNGVDTVEVTGAQGVVIDAYARNKTSSISGVNGLICGGLLADQVGTDIVTGKQTIENYLEYLVLTSADTVTTKFKAVGATGAEIKAIYKYDGVATRLEVEQAETADDTHYAYDPETKTLTLPTGSFEAGEQICIQYDYEVENVDKIVNSADKFTTNCRLEIMCTYKDMCTKKLKVGKIIYPCAKADGNFDIETGDTPAAHNFTFKAISDVCSVNKELWTEFIYD